MYRNAFKRSRCIIPASGYYEWRAEGGAKQPYYFSATEGGVLSISVSGMMARREQPLAPPLLHDDCHRSQ